MKNKMIRLIITIIRVIVQVEEIKINKKI